MTEERAPYDAGTGLPLGVPFEIDGPDADGLVWLRWINSDGLRNSLNLGDFGPVGDGFTDWLAQTDYGEGGKPLRVQVTIGAGK